MSDGAALPTRAARTAAIVGLNWGLVHLRGLREAGCEIVALAASDAARAQQIAAREGVPLGTDRLEDLRGVDVVVVATPASTHEAVIRSLPEPFLICEKPLLGTGGGSLDGSSVGGRLLVNYAFGFLATARAAASVVGDLGTPDRTELEVGVELPHAFTAVEWVAEAASHPLSWLVHLFGAPELRSCDATERRVDARAVIGGVPTALRLDVGGDPGIRQRITMFWGQRQLTLSGSFSPGAPWRYEPLLLDGAAITDGEWSPTDCWLDANAASVGAMVGVFRGETPWRDGIDRGLFDLEKALMVDSMLTAVGRARPA